MYKRSFSETGLFRKRRRAHYEGGKVQPSRFSNATINRSSPGDHTMALRCFGVLSFACFCVILHYSSPALVQGTPVKTKTRHPREKPLRVLNIVYNYPTVRLRGRLLSRTGYFLEILQNGTIHTTLNDSSIYTILELQTYNKTLKRFFGFHSRRYLAYEMISRRKGGFVGVDKLSNNSLFVEHMEHNHYLTYRPLIYPARFNSTGYLAIKDNGKFRRLERSKPGMHASQFTFLPQK